MISSRGSCIRARGSICLCQEVRAGDEMGQRLSQSQYGALRVEPGASSALAMALEGSSS
jgi:hypothetical protein